MVMRIEDVFLEFRMTGDVDLCYALRGHAVYVREWIEVVVPRGNVNIVYIQKGSAIRPLHYFIQELPFDHLRNTQFGIAADVLDGNGDLKEVPHLANLFRRKASRCNSVRH